MMDIPAVSQPPHPPSFLFAGWAEMVVSQSRAVGPVPKRTQNGETLRDIPPWHLLVANRTRQGQPSDVSNGRAGLEKKEVIVDRSGVLNYTWKEA